jgi:signal transduction histidine kinase
MNENLRIKSREPQPAQIHHESPDMRLRSVLDSISDCYFTIDGDYRICDINEAAARWVAGEKAALLGQDMFTVFDKTSDADRNFIREVVTADGAQHVELACSIHPGRWVDLDIYPSGTGASFFFRDITERKASQAAMEAARGLLASTLDAIGSEIVILDDSGRILLANETFYRFLRASEHFVQDDGIGEFYLGLDALRPAKGDMAAYEAGIRDVLCGARAEFRCELQTKAADGKRSYRLHVARFEAGGWNRVVVVRDDVTELVAARHDVDSLVARLVNLQERERQRYASELHDSTVQHITAASLNLMALRSRIVKQPALDGVLDNIERSLAEAQREIRSVSYLLYPRALDDDGLSSTLERFVSGYSARTRIEAQLRVSGTPDLLPMSMQRTVLRIIQEALSNVHRHASATNVRVSIAVRRRTLSVCIADNGKGMAAARGVGDSEGEQGVGIPGMKARTHQFGGSLRLRSGTRGTLVLARIPLSRQFAHADEPASRANARLSLKRGSSGRATGGRLGAVHQN